MATAKQKSTALEAWSCEFPELTAINKKFLVKRSGHLITGICLDELRDKSSYKPTFFCHNLLVSFPVLSLAYAAPLLSRGVYKPVKYGVEIGSFATELKEKVCIAQGQKFSIFWEHIKNAIEGKYGQQMVYLPHALRDLLSLKSACVSKETSLDMLEMTCLYLKSRTDVNFNLVGSLNEWSQEVEQLIKSNHSELAEKNATNLKLSSLEVNQFECDEVEEFWKL